MNLISIGRWWDLNSKNSVKTTIYIFYKVKVVQISCGLWIFVGAESEFKS
jgi:hypothetical protein